LLSGTGALELILREFYESCIGDQPLSVREFVEDELLTESGFRETVAVERAERMLAQRKAEPSAINLLVDRRLLRYEERLEIRRVELAHDVLTGVIKSSRDERLSRQGSKALIEAGEDKLTDGTYLQAAVFFAAAYKLLDDVSTVTERLQRDLIKCSKALANQILILKGHTNWVTSAAFSADGKKLVTASWDKKIRLWDVSSGASNDLATMPGKGLSVSLSPDGTRVVAGCWNGYGYVWDVDGNLVATLDGHRGRVNYAAFSPDGKRIVTASDDSTMRVWLLDGTQILREEHTDFVKSAVYSQDGKAILTAGYDGTVKIWDSSSCQLLRTIDAAKEGQTELNFAAFSPDRKSVATVGLGTEVILWDLDGRKIESLPGHRRRINHVQFDHSGRLLVTASDDGTAKVWDIAHAELWMSMERHKGRVLSAVFSSDDDLLVTTSDDRTARLWSTRLQEETFSELVTKIDQEAPWRIVNGRLVEK